MITGLLYTRISTLSCTFLPLFLFSAADWVGVMVDNENPYLLSTSAESNPAALNRRDGVSRWIAAAVGGIKVESAGKDRQRNRATHPRGL